MTLQPIGGMIHHLIWKKKQVPTWWGYCHRWLGRAAVIMGIINIGLGFMLGPPSWRRILGYSEVATVCGTIYIVVTILYGPEAKYLPAFVKTGVRNNDGAVRGGSIDTTSTAQAIDDAEKEDSNTIRMRAL